MRSAAASALNNSQELLFATNGGIFDHRFDPVGLLVDNGMTLAPLNLRRSVGNFYLQPNGVFWIRGAIAAMCESHRYPATCLPDLAIQSGPMLVINRSINPNFDPRSTNRTIRSGIGIVDPHHVVLAISDAPVTFAQFATLFRDRLGCTDALYLDGKISRLFVAGTNEADDEQRFATLLVVSR